MKPQSQQMSSLFCPRKPWKRFGARGDPRLRLAQVLQHRGAFAEAEPLRRRVLDGFERQLGPEHCDTLASVQNLATVLEDLGQFHEAPLLRPGAGRRGRAAFCFWEQLGKHQGNNQRIFRSSQYCLMYIDAR